MILFIILVILITLLVRGAYNAKKGQPLSYHSAFVSVPKVDNGERDCREADYQQPTLYVIKTFICDQLMLHLYALY